MANWLEQLQQQAQNGANGRMENVDNAANGVIDPQTTSDAVTVATATAGSADAINTTITKTPATGVAGAVSKTAGTVGFGTNGISAWNNFSEGNTTSGVYDAISAAADAATVLQPETAPIAVPISMGSQVLKQQYEEHQTKMEQTNKEIDELKAKHESYLENGEDYLNFNDPLLGKLYELDIQNTNDMKISDRAKAIKQINEDLENGKYGEYTSYKESIKNAENQSDDRNLFQKLFGSDDNHNNSNNQSNETKSYDWKDHLDPDLKEQAIYNEKNGYVGEERKLIEEQLKRNENKEQDNPNEQSQTNDTPKQSETEASQDKDNKDKNIFEKIFDKIEDISAKFDGRDSSWGKGILEKLLKLTDWLNGGFDWLGDKFNDYFGLNRSGKFHVIVYDPLVLDLDGDGVELVAENNWNGVLFDFNGNGIKTATQWVSSDDGLLVWDRNKNGKIDNGSELFGEDTIKRPTVDTLGGASKPQEKDDGFDALGTVDSNLDGKINAKDSEWKNLRVWCDLNACNDEFFIKHFVYNFQAA